MNKDSSIFILLADTPGVNQQNQHEKLFESHLLQRKQLYAERNNTEVKDWITGVIILAVIIITWVRVNYYKTLRQIINAFYSKIHYTELMRDNDSPVRISYVALDVIFAIIFSLFIYKMSMFFGWALSAYSGFVYYLQILFLILFIYPLKTIALKTAGFIFEAPDKFSEYTLNILTINKLLGFILLPIVIFIEFLPSTQGFLINTGIAILSVAYLFRLLKLIIIGKSEKFLSGFYLFLYLCALEILPTIILAKIFADKV